jgi:hypothetical protein
MRMWYAGATMTRWQLLLLVATGSLAGLSACGAEAANDTASNSGSGSASFTVVSNRPLADSTTGESFELGVSITSASSACARTTVGACTVNPCYQAAAPAGTTLPSAGQVGITAPEMMPFAVSPQADGIYPWQSVLGQVPWTTGGESVTLKWAHFPGDDSLAGDTITLDTPPYVTLTAGSAFGDSVSTIARSSDLTLTWTTDSPPAATDELVVDVVMAPVQIYCAFADSAGTGVVPASVLGQLSAGSGSYDVHSKQFASETRSGANGGSWNFSFNIDATARTRAGLASGSVTIQ